LVAVWRITCAKKKKGKGEEKRGINRRVIGDLIAPARALPSYRGGEKEKKRRRGGGEDFFPGSTI